MNSGRGRSFRNRYRPCRFSVFSLTPVHATAAPNSPMIAVPWVPRKRESRPAITSAAIRPCRLAGPASAIRLHSPVTKSLTSTASPTAKMSGSLVRIWSSTRMPPRSPICQSGRFRQRGIGAHAEGEDHDVSRIGLAGFGLHVDGAMSQPA